jgi:2'-5' RNA ligase
VSDPFVVTVALDAASQARFEALRREHFPSARNLVPAHVSVFHHLPPDDTTPDVVRQVLAELAPRASVMAVTGVRSLGRGVAYTLDAPGVAVVRAALARQFEEHLTPQDRQPWRPHVTVQNKVAPDAARALLARLGAGFSPFEVMAEGLLVWRYRGGPWELVRTLPFGDR